MTLLELYSGRFFENILVIVTLLLGAASVFVVATMRNRSPIEKAFVLLLGLSVAVASCDRFIEPLVEAGYDHDGVAKVTLMALNTTLRLAAFICGVSICTISVIRKQKTQRAVAEAAKRNSEYTDLWQIASAKSTGHSSQHLVAH